MIANYASMCFLRTGIRVKKYPIFALDVIVTNCKIIVSTPYIVIQVLTTTLPHLIGIRTTPALKQKRIIGANHAVTV